MTEIIYMPQQVYAVFVIVNTAMIYYGFTTDDRSYYTDIIACFGSFILSALVLSYQSLIGISIDNGDYYTSPVFAGVFVAVGVLMLIFTIVKILELNKNEADNL